MRLAASSTLRALAAVAALGGGLTACAPPSNTNTTFSSAAVGRTASVSRGTILSMREVQIDGSGGGPGIGGLAGAAAGGVAGSFIGGDTRSNILGALGGALIGGLAGNAVQNQVGRGTATEFIIQEDGGGTIAVVQSNEDRFVPGERVLIIRGDRTRLARGAV
jgi:outer membrane lipoprotein SlyB